MKRPPTEAACFNPKPWETAARRSLRVWQYHSIAVLVLHMIVGCRAAKLLLPNDDTELLCDDRRTTMPCYYRSVDITGSDYQDNDSAEY